MKKFIIIAILLISNMGIFGTVNTEIEENINIPKETESNVVEIVDTKEEKNIQEENDDKETEESENKITSKEQTKIETETPKEQITIQSKQADNTISKNQETKQKPQENMQQEVTKEQTVTENKKEKETEKEENQNQEKKDTAKSNNTTKELKCSNGNHFMDVGNSNQWFATEQEAVAHYEELVAEKGNLCRNNKMTDEEYNKECPSGCEIWSCICGMWTVNFYYLAAD